MMTRKFEDEKLFLPSEFMNAFYLVERHQLLVVTELENKLLDSNF